MKYNDYINSPAWKTLCNTFLKENPICNICNKYLAEEVHHKSYENFGNEDLEDLEGLCSRCHFGLHEFPPYILDITQRNKAIKIMNYFKLYPSIKTMVLNDVSRKYFNSEFMLDVSRRESDNTPMFSQNLMEIFDKKGNAIGEDIIEFVLGRCIMYKIEAGKNAYNKSQQKSRAEKSINVYAEVIKNPNPLVPVEVLTEQQKRRIKITRFCMNKLNDREVLKSAKSYFNRKFFNGNLIFNNVGAKTPSNFIVYLDKKELLNELFIFLGGNNPDEF